MFIGGLRQRATIEKREDGYDDAGQPINGWAHVATVWADVRFASGMESIKADAQVSINRASIRIRYREGITAGMRIVCDGVIFNILAVLPDIAKRSYVDLPCEVVNGY